MTRRFLGMTGAAAHIGASRSWLEKHWRELPEPDAWVGDKKGWSVETLDAWKASGGGPLKPGRPLKDSCDA